MLALSVCQCDPVSAEGITRGISNGNYDFVMEMEVCESDLEMEHVIFINPGPQEGISVKK